MKSPALQRDEVLDILCDVLSALAEDKPSFTAQSFVDRARANIRCGNSERAIEYVKIAQSYVAPGRVTV